MAGKRLQAPGGAISKLKRLFKGKPKVRRGGKPKPSVSHGAGQAAADYLLDTIPRSQRKPGAKSVRPK